MKHQIFKLLVILWRLCPLKFLMSKIVKRNSFLFKKLYSDLRYKGIMNVEVKDKSFKLFNPGFTTIENEIYWKGINEGWEKISLSLWQKLVVVSKKIIDIGANSGVYSFVAAALNPEATIYAFEPVKRTAQIFKKNLELNPTFNIKLYETAVSNKNGKAIFYDIKTKSQYSASLNKDMLKDKKNRVSYDVDIVSIDTIDEISNSKIDLIKLDVEMHEPEAIEGMINMLERDKPTMLIEILNDDLGEKIEKLVSDINYYYFTIDEMNEPKRTLNLKKSGMYNYLLCTKEIAYKINLNCEL